METHWIGAQRIGANANDLILWSSLSWTDDTDARVGRVHGLAQELNVSPVIASAARQ